MNAEINTGRKNIPLHNSPLFVPTFSLQLQFLVSVPHSLLLQSTRQNKSGLDHERPWGQDKGSLFQPTTDIAAFDLTCLQKVSWLFHVSSHLFLNKKTHLELLLFISHLNKALLQQTLQSFNVLFFLLSTEPKSQDYHHYLYSDEQWHWMITTLSPSLNLIQGQLWGSLHMKVKWVKRISTDRKTDPFRAIILFWPDQKSVPAVPGSLPLVTRSRCAKPVGQKTREDKWQCLSETKQILVSNINKGCPP